MKDMALNSAADLQLARAERRIEELMSWAKLRRRLAGSVRRQLKLAQQMGSYELHQSSVS
jgi:hypothetical protein